MENEITFFSPGVPVAKGRARARHVKTKEGREFDVHYTPKKTRQAETDFALAAQEHAPESGPTAGGVRLVTEFFMPIPKSDSQKKQEAKANGEILHLQKPEFDNLIKLVADALKGISWVDDKQIISGAYSVAYSRTPGTRVTVTELEKGE